ncbi:MAG TPA: ADP-forming succinate--CoA ligase subunit beta [Polyangiaceae bacterium]|jgi:succinyl-CoA synthetase beta subunit|nr:ADP-forming succinate--CoA ligase subunit beta [Polyangiaceae bacterium]
MNIHEYQGKQIFAKYGIPVPKGIAVFKPEDTKAAAEKLMQETGVPVVVVKAQIHAGGRGKAGGVKVVKSADDAQAKANEIFGKALVTHQTGPEGQTVRRLYVEQGLDIARELYLGLVVDRTARRIAVMASTEGGVEIEHVAATTPEKIITVHVDPLLGLAPYQARKIAYALKIAVGSPDPKKTNKQFGAILTQLVSLFEKEDCSLCEVNPLIITKSGDVVALDSKVNLDDNASGRHPEWAEMLDKSEEDPVELEAKQAGLSYVSLGGNIGCLVNGAGLAMATMDIIQHHGGTPANFLDVGGGATKDQVKKAFGMILSSAKVKGIFVNIFGGIAKCDLIAEGIIAATKELGLRVPLVVRLEGTNVELGKKLLRESGLAISAADSMADGAKKIVAAVAG